MVAEGTVPAEIPTWVFVAAGVLLSVLVIYGRIAAWYGEVNSDRKSFKEFMKEVRDDIKELLERIPKRTFASQSPVSLTDYGKEVAESMGAPDWAERLAPELMREFTGAKAYEVDEFATKYVAEGSENLTEEWETRIAECAYQFGLKREEVRTVLRIVLRQAILDYGNFPGPEDRPTG